MGQENDPMNVRNQIPIPGPSATSAEQVLFGGGIPFTSYQAALNQLLIPSGNPINIGGTLLTGFDTTGWDQTSKDNANGFVQEREELLKKIAILKKENARAELIEEELNKLKEKEKIFHLLVRVNENAQKKLLKSKEFVSQFQTGRQIDAFVMAVDIRRSTEMMLKARSPEDYADFISGLCAMLRAVILLNYGVFDKFTGDGILAYFPKYYSGVDMSHYVLNAARKCHEIFESFYSENRRRFNAVLLECGLGIGIDFGPINLVQIGFDLTVVGTPVVYACRFSGAKYGTTLCNQPGWEKIGEDVGGRCEMSECEIDIKHEGRMLGYQVKLKELKKILRNRTGNNRLGKKMPLF